MRHMMSIQKKDFKDCKGKRKTEISKFLKGVRFQMDILCFIFAVFRSALLKKTLIFYCTCVVQDFSFVASVYDKMDIDRKISKNYQM